MRLPGDPKAPVERLASPEEEARVFRHAFIAGPDRALGLQKRVVEEFRSRGWPTNDDLIAVVAAALAITRIEEVVSPDAVAYGWTGRAHDDERAAVFFRRPPGAEGCGGRWPETATRARPRELVRMLDLDGLLVPK